MEVKIRIYPSAGNTYQVTLSIPEHVGDTDTYIDNWIDKNLKFVEYYETVAYL